MLGMQIAKAGSREKKRPGISKGNFLKTLVTQGDYGFISQFLVLI